MLLMRVMLQIRASAGSPRVPGDGPRPRRPHAQSGGSRVIRPQHRGQQRLRSEPGPWAAAARPRPPAPVPPQVPGGQSVPRPRPPVHQPRPPGGEAASAQEPGPDVLRPGRAPAVCLGVAAPAAGAAPAPVHHQLPVQPRHLGPGGPGWSGHGAAFPRPATPGHAPHQSVQFTVQSPGAARHNQLQGLLPLLVRKNRLMMFVSTVVTRSRQARARSDLNKRNCQLLILSSINVCP